MFFFQKWEIKKKIGDIVIDIVVENKLCTNTDAHVGFLDFISFYS